MSKLSQLKMEVLSSTSAAAMHSAKITTDLLRVIIRKALVIFLIGGVALMPAQAHAFNLGKAINHAVINAGKSIEKGTHDAGRSVQTAAQQTGHAIEKGTHDAGNSIQTAAQQTGHAIEKGTHDVGHYIEEHPLEAALMLAMVGGGAYLVAFQNFDLVVQGVTVVHGGAWAGWTGGAVAGLGSGGLAAGASTMPSPTSNADVVIQTTFQKPPAPVTSPPSLPAGGRSPDTALQSVYNQPQQLSDVDGRIKNSMNTLEWIERDKILETFRASDSPGLSPAEMRIIDALESVLKIPDSAADIAAKKQQKDREQVFENTIRQLRVPTSESPQILIADLLKSVGKLAIQPTIPGDGQAAAREHHVKLLQDKLEAFRMKRIVQELAAPKNSAIPATLPPEGPVMKAL